MGVSHDQAQVHASPNKAHRQAKAAYVAMPDLQSEVEGEMKKLTDPMIKTLRIMAVGHEIEIRRGIQPELYGDPAYYMPPSPGSSPPDDLIWALIEDKLIVSVKRRKDWPPHVIIRYALAAAGRRAAEEAA